MSLRSSLLVFAFVLFAAGSSAQQLLIMKRGKVVSRFNPGDELLFQFKSEKQVNRVTIQSLREFYFVTTSKDTIQYLKIGRIVFRNPGRQKYAVSVFGMGAALLAIWGVNTLAFDSTSPSMRGLRVVGFIAVGVGTFMYFTANSGTKMKGGTRLKYVSYDSPLYR